MPHRTAETLSKNVKIRTVWQKPTGRSHTIAGKYNPLPQAGEAVRLYAEGG
jgi:hypothetical protein